MSLLRRVVGFQVGDIVRIKRKRCEEWYWRRPHLVDSAASKRFVILYENPRSHFFELQCVSSDDPTKIDWRLNIVADDLELA